MAGPTALVLFADAASRKLTWRDIMRGVADSWHDDSLCHVLDSLKFGGTYTGEPRPFVGAIYTIKNDPYRGVTLDELVALNRALNTEFTHCIELGAMCNSSVDHQLLCEIARFLAQQHRGYIDFNDVITENVRDDLLTVTWMEDGHEYRTQIGTPSACDWWLEQDRFRMVK